YEIRATNMPSVLIEGGFMDSKIDIVKLRDDKVLKQAGINLAHAVAEYGGIKKVSSSTSTPQTTPKPVVQPPKPKVKSATKVKSSAGSKSAGMIANIQATLNRRYETGIKVDNKYGPKTKKALIKAYQIELNKQFN